MYTRAGHDQYKNVSVSTVDQGRLLLMLYDGCLNFLRQAKVGLEAHDVPKFARFLSKGQAIIAYLLSTLDFTNGGTIARDLSRLYEFMMFHLTEANLKKDAKRVGEVIEMLDRIAGAYHDIIDGGKVNFDELRAMRQSPSTSTPTDTSASEPRQETTPRIRVSL